MREKIDVREAAARHIDKEKEAAIDALRREGFRPSDARRAIEQITDPTIIATLEKIAEDEEECRNKIPVKEIFEHYYNKGYHRIKPIPLAPSYLVQRLAHLGIRARYDVEEEHITVENPKRAQEILQRLHRAYLQQLNEVQPGETDNYAKDLVKELISTGRPTKEARNALGQEAARLLARLSDWRGHTKKTVAILRILAKAIKENKNVVVITPGELKERAKSAEEDGFGHSISAKELPPRALRHFAEEFYFIETGRRQFRDKFLVFIRPRKELVELALRGAYTGRRRRVADIRSR